MWASNKVLLKQQGTAQLVQKKVNVLATHMAKSVIDEDHVRTLAREGRMGVELPESVLKMTEGYEFRVYWFELIECARKLALTGMPVWFELGSVSQLTSQLAPSAGRPAAAAAAANVELMEALTSSAELVVHTSHKGGKGGGAAAAPHLAAEAAKVRRKTLAEKICSQVEWYLAEERLQARLDLT